jgi:uracil-DNA glycosylase family 4
MNDTLSTLNWLVEAGADEAVADAPVNRLVAKTPVAAMPAPVPRAPARAPTPPLSLDNDAIDGALAAASSATTLEELKAALENFDGCGLKRTATSTVFADGVASGGVMLIGEAPGRDEDRVGKPFVGRAGQLLDKMLAAIALDRRTNAYITNVINWRPPDNRDPTPEEAAACLPFLRRHIELAEPKVIILLGAVAARHVVGGNEGIMKLRGRWLEYRVGDRMVPLMPTLHPAYLLRQPAHKKLAWRDLQAVAAKMEMLGLPEPGSRAN